MKYLVILIYASLHEENDRDMSDVIGIFESKFEAESVIKEHKMLPEDKYIYYVKGKAR